jgi:hypothetical protein
MSLSMGLLIRPYSQIHFILRRGMDVAYESLPVLSDSIREIRAIPGHVGP